MGYCGYCEELPTNGFFASYCENCAMLRRLLKVHNSKICVDILRRVLIRNDKQIGYKIDKEIVGDSRTTTAEQLREQRIKKEDEGKPITRSNKK